MKIHCSAEAKILCERLDLDMNKKVEALSFGNRKKVGIVCALQHKPDLIFMEFAINDEGDDYKNVAAQTETIFRTVIGCNDDTDIVTVITTGEPIIDYMKKGIPVASIQAQKDVSSYYNIPVADVGTNLFAQLIESSLSLADRIPDGLHPNNEGHKIYADALKMHLEEWMHGQ